MRCMWPPPSKAGCKQIYTFNLRHFRELAPELGDRMRTPFGDSQITQPSVQPGPVAGDLATELLLDRRVHQDPVHIRQSGGHPQQRRDPRRPRRPGRFRGRRPAPGWSARSYSAARRSVAARGRMSSPTSASRPIWWLTWPPGRGPPRARRCPRSAVSAVRHPSPRGRTAPDWRSSAAPPRKRCGRGGWSGTPAPSGGRLTAPGDAAASVRAADDVQRPRRRPGRTPSRRRTRSGGWRHALKNSKPALEDGDDVTRLNEALPGCLPFDRNFVEGPHHGSIRLQLPGR